MAWGDIEWWNGIEHVELKNQMWKQTGRARIEPWMTDKDKQHILNNGYDVLGYDMKDDRAPDDLDEGLQPMKKKLRSEPDAPDVDMTTPTTPPSQTNTPNNPQVKRKSEETIEPSNKKLKMETETEQSKEPQSSLALMGSHETPVDVPRYIQGGFFPETITVKLPIVFYLSANALWKERPVVMRLGLNSPYNILEGNTLVAQTEGSQKSRGLSNCNSKVDTDTNFTAWDVATNFPTVVKGSVPKTSNSTSSGTIADLQCVPSRRTAYEKIYEHYTTLACDYTVECEFAADNYQDKAIVFWQRDCVTQNSQADKLPTDRNLNQMRSYPAMKSTTLEPRNIPGRGDFNFKTKIQGHWEPNTSRRNVINDEEIKTWTNVGTAPVNNYRETDVFCFFSDWTTEGALEQCINMRIFMEWTVQFKDIKNYIRYPAYGQVVAQPNLIVYPTDFIQTPSTSEDTL
jgi:hypothetical protein